MEHIVLECDCQLRKKETQNAKLERKQESRRSSVKADRSGP